MLATVSTSMTTTTALIFHTALFQFFVLLVIIFVGEIALAVLAYFNEAPYQDVIKRSVAVTVNKKYHKNSTATMQTFDLIQEGVSPLKQVTAVEGIILGGSYSAAKTRKHRQF
jgi:hypothetical protein